MSHCRRRLHHEQGGKARTLTFSGAGLGLEVSIWTHNFLLIYVLKIDKGINTDVPACVMWIHSFLAVSAEDS